jgi:hypothetical protein
MEVDGPIDLDLVALNYGVPPELPVMIRLVLINLRT